MTAAGGLGKRAEAGSVLRRVAANFATWILALCRPPPVGIARRPRRPSLSRIVIGAGLSVSAVIAVMLLFDGWAIALRRDFSPWVIVVFDELTDFGKSSWFLWPTGLLLLTIAAVASPRLGRTAYLVLMSLAVRLGFVFLAVAVPSLFVTIAKRIIGRARPLRIDGSDVYFAPFSWRVEFASLPSGHSTTAFAAAVAIGALYPRARPALWIYAGTIALSRVILASHFPSDVIAGAFVGGCGALIVRDWFAGRRLGFAVASDGSIRAMPGPSLLRIKKVVRRLAGQ